MEIIEKRRTFAYISNKKEQMGQVFTAIGDCFRAIFDGIGQCLYSLFGCIYDILGGCANIIIGNLVMFACFISVLWIQSRVVYRDSRNMT